MTTHKEALTLALEALKPRAGMPEPEYESLVNCAITAIKEALAQPEQELTNLERHERSVQQLFGTQQPKEPEQEPVAYETWYEKFHSFVGKSPLLYSDLHCAWQAAKLYTTPPQRKPHPDCDSGCMYVCTEGGQRLPKCEQRKPLTDEQIFVIKHNWITTPFVNHLDFARAIEAAHGIKE